MEIQKLDFKKRSFVLSIKVIKLVDSLPGKPSLWVVGKQLIRSISSIGANAVEAKASSSRKEFINFYNYSLKSANESLYWLAILKEVYKHKSNDIDLLMKETKELSKILASSIITLKKLDKK